MNIINEIFGNKTVIDLKKNGIFLDIKNNGDILSIGIFFKNIYLGKIYISNRRFNTKIKSINNIFVVAHNLNFKYKKIIDLIFLLIKKNSFNINNFLLGKDIIIRELKLYDNINLSKLSGFFKDYNKKYFNLDFEFNIDFSVRNFGKNILVEGNGLRHGENIEFFIKRLYEESVKNGIKLYLYCGDSKIFDFIFGSNVIKKVFFEDIYIGSLDEKIKFDLLLSNFYTEDFFNLSLLKNIKQISIIEWHLGAFRYRDKQGYHLDTIYENLKGINIDKKLVVYHGHPDDENTISSYGIYFLDNRVFNSIDIKFIGYPVDTKNIKYFKGKKESYIFSGGNNNRDYKALYDIFNKIDNNIIIRTNNPEIKLKSTDKIDIGRCSYKVFLDLEKISLINCLLLDSKKYQMGGVTTLVEMMALGTTIISTIHSSINPYIVDGNNGFLIDMYDNNMLLEKINILNNDKNLRVALGKKAREYAENYMDYNIIIYDIFNNL